MSNLVFLVPNNKEPFTTSEVIAACAQITHDAVQKMISRHEADFKSFGKVGFEIRAVKKNRGIKYEKVYRLNEQQATLLMTYLRNSEVVRAFKMELVRQFYAMRQELQRCNAAKLERKPIRRTLTDAIKAMPDSPHKKWKYAQYTNLVYLAAFGKTAKEIRMERGAKKTDTASDFLTAGELEQVNAYENRVAVLSEAGLDYHQIKALLLERQRLSA